MIKDPLTHMIRNSADHGLESPAERVKRGKPETGRIKLSAFQQGGYIVIEVADDGSGLDVQKIRAKAIERGLATAAELDRLSDADICKIIFKAGSPPREKSAASRGAASAWMSSAPTWN
jgi:two-component system chemotaxis sensor kinase CheA